MEVNVTYAALYREAVNLGIKGRSSMNKAALASAISGLTDKSLGSALQKRVDERGVGTCSYAFRTRSGVTNIFAYDVCHARLCAHEPIVEIVLNMRGHSEKYDGDALDQYRAYADYLMNRSPIATSFLTKTVEDAEESGVYLDCSRPFDELVVAAVMLREGSEFNRGRHMSNYMSQGVPERAAHLLACLTNSNNALIEPTGWHTTVSGTQELDGLIKFFRTGFHRRKSSKGANDSACSRYEILDTVAKDALKHVLEMTLLSEWLKGRIDVHNWSGVADKASVPKEKTISDIIKLLESES